MRSDWEFFRLDWDGRVWLKFYGDFSDPDEPTPADIQVSDKEILGYADDRPGVMRTLIQMKICLLDDARKQLEQVFEEWEDNAVKEETPAFPVRRFICTA